MNIRKQFPLLTRAFAEIDADNGNFHILKKGATVPKGWEKRFTAAEDGLSLLVGKRLDEFFSDEEMHDMGMEHLLDGKATPADFDIFSAVVLPVDESAAIIMQRMAVRQREARAVEQVLYEYFDGKLSALLHEESAYMQRMRAERVREAAKCKVVVVLEVMWGLPGDRPLRWFSINPDNHSGRRLNSMIDGAYTVTNACSDIVHSARHRGTPDKVWLEANLRKLQPDVLLVCGKVAQATFSRSMAPKARVLVLPHPAARTWSKASIAAARNKIQQAITEAKNV